MHVNQTPSPINSFLFSYMYSLLVSLAARFWAFTHFSYHSRSYQQSFLEVYVYFAIEDVILLDKLLLITFPFTLAAIFSSYFRLQQAMMIAICNMDPTFEKSMYNIIINTSTFQIHPRATPMLKMVKEKARLFKIVCIFHNINHYPLDSFVARSCAKVVVSQISNKHENSNF